MLRFLAVEVRVDFLREHATRFKRGCRSLFLDGGEGLLCHPLSVFDVGVELSSVGGHSYGCLCSHDFTPRCAQLYRFRLGNCSPCWAPVSVKQDPFQAESRTTVWVPDVMAITKERFYFGDGRCPDMPGRNRCSSHPGPQLRLRLTEVA